MNLLGIDPVRVAGDLAKGLVGLALAPLEQTAVLSRERRKVWSCPGRLHIEAHGVHGPRGKQVAGRIESALETHPGVLWARVNAPSARVIVAAMLWHPVYWATARRASPACGMHVLKRRSPSRV